MEATECRRSPDDLSDWQRWQCEAGPAPQESRRIKMVVVQVRDQDCLDVGDIDTEADG
jgi:hypothetical protein